MGEYFYLWFQDFRPPVPPRDYTVQGTRSAFKLGLGLKAERVPDGMDSASVLFTEARQL